MAESQELKIVINAEDKATKELEKFERNVKSTDTSLGKLVSGVALGNLAYNAFQKAVGFASGVISDSIKEYQTGQLAIERLKRSMQNVTSATDKNVDALLDQADALQKVTRFSDDQIISAQGILSTFQLNQGAIKTLTPRLLDMAEGVAKASGNMADLENIAMALGKVVGGEEGAVGALKRYGVTMTKSQEEQFKTAKGMERMNLVAEILDGNYAGLAETAGNTMPGKMAIMQHSVDNVKDSIGAALAPVVSDLATRISNFVQTEQFQAFLNRLTTEIIPAFITALSNVANFIINTVIPAISNIVNWLKEHKGVTDAMTTALIAAAAAFAGIKTAMAIGDTINAAKAGFSAISGVLGQSGVAGAAGLAQVGLLGIVTVATLIAIDQARKAYSGLQQDIAALNQTAANGRDMVGRLDSKLRESKTEEEKRKWEGLRDQMQAAVDKADEVERRYKGGTGFFNAVKDTVSSWFGGKKQFGGPVSAHTPYMVGERGPEMFVPKSDGKIVPNNALSGGVTVNINASVRSDSDITSIISQVEEYFSRRLRLSQKGVI